MFFLKLLGVLILVSWIIFLLVISLLLRKKIQDIKKKREEQEAALEAELEKEKRQKEEEKRRNEERLNLKASLKPKYQSNPNLNKMFDYCVDAILTLCKERQNSLIAQKGCGETLEFETKVTGDYIQILPGCPDLYFANFDIIPIRGDNVRTKVITIREILSERLCSEINKINPNIKAEIKDNNHIYVTITNEPQGVRL